MPENPVPIGTHAAPFQRATALAATPPATVNAPPATMSPLAIVVSALTVASMPEPSGDQPPLHSATRLTGTFPADVN